MEERRETIGTAEEIEAARAEVMRLKSLGAPKAEWRRASTVLMRLCKSKVPRRQGVIDVRLRRALEAEEKARKAENNLGAVIQRVDLTAWMTKVVAISTDEYLEAVRQDLKSNMRPLRDRAMQRMAVLQGQLVTLFEALSGPSKSQKGRVERPMWPSEAQKT